MKVLALLFVYGRSSRGVATPIRDTPRDVLSIRKSNFYCSLQLIEYGGDLEAFAKHAKRSTVQADDVKLLVRRNKGLVSELVSLVIS